MSNDTEGYPDLELGDLEYNEAFYGWVEQYRDDSGEVAAQWVLLKACRQLWPAAFSAVETDGLTAVAIKRVKFWRHKGAPIVAPTPTTVITSRHDHEKFRTVRNNPYA